ncbi:hypothetical protein [Archangium violaceum]|uniref:Uncharacterized protein n=1 Tax=Archangium violaceum Cb vi76 TaxID=1406225 RepID=A0A084SHN3_9BACT|nr:hypothetical protein [Archangium violaceum]KFA87968.1 hypothetical protein Q664_44210 [Archangium violaceum Cb vi76]
MALEGRGYTLAAWSGVLLILLCLALTLEAGRWSDAFLVSGFLALSIAYLTLVRQLPAVLDLVVVLTALLNAVGWGGGLLRRVWFFDDLLHLLTPLTGAVLICLRLGQAVGPPLTARRALLWTLATALTLSAGVLWEFAEWVANSLRFPLEDTLPDLLLDTLGAMMGSALALRLMDRYPPGMWRGPARAG